MLPEFGLMEQLLRGVIEAKTAQGHETRGLHEQLAGLPRSYDAYDAFARQLASLPMRGDWDYDEPNDYEAVAGACDPARQRDAIATVDPDDAAKRVRTGFLASVCGCQLGKPLECNPTLAEIRAAAEQVGDWPLRDYISTRLLDALGRRHHSWRETCREHLRDAAPDDDINYTILGMLLIEQHGSGFTHDDIRRLWLDNLAVSITFGPERVTLVKAAMNSLRGGENDYEAWVNRWNPRDELCGAAIRADAYGYACPGQPELAAKLAWRDASFTHRRTGIYSTMFIAASIAVAQVVPMYAAGDVRRLGVFETALRYVPQRSRFHAMTLDMLGDVAAADDWLDGYERIHADYAQYDHCRVYQEVGTLMNTLRFAESIGDGLCKQVSQGNDTDSFGATAGSMLGCYFGGSGGGVLEARWLDPLCDRIRVELARFYEQSLSSLADRMAALPRRLAGASEAEGPEAEVSGAATSRAQAQTQAGGTKADAGI